MDASTTLFRNATVFDGSGQLPRLTDLLVRDGRIAMPSART